MGKAIIRNLIFPAIIALSVILSGCTIWENQTEEIRPVPKTGSNIEVVPWEKMPENVEDNNQIGLNYSRLSYY